MKTLDEVNDQFSLYPVGKFDTVTAQALFRMHVLYQTFSQELFDLMKDKPGEIREDAFKILFNSKVACIETLIGGIQVQPAKETQGAIEAKPEPKKRGRKPKETNNAH